MLGCIDNGQRVLEDPGRLPRLDALSPASLWPPCTPVFGCSTRGAQACQPTRSAAQDEAEPIKLEPATAADLKKFAPTNRQAFLNFWPPGAVHA